MSLPLVSIAITTKNEGKNITACLESIKNQTYPKNKIEIIIVDNQSTDNTKKIAKQYTQNVFNKGPERSAQRNYAANKAKGKYFLFLDADMRLTKELVNDCVNKMELDQNLVALYISEQVLGNKFWSRVRNFERSFYDATVIDCVRFISLKHFKEINGCDLTMSGPEDWDFNERIKKLGKLDLITTPVLHDESDFNLKKYLSKKKYYSASMDKYIKKWGKNYPAVKKQLGFFYRFFIVFIENGKFLKLVRHPIYTLAMYCLRFRVAVNYLKFK